MAEQTRGNGAPSAALQRQQQATAQLNTLRSMLERSKERLAEVVPKHLTPERLVRITVALAARTPDILECSPPSILNCVMQAGQLGLEPGGALGQFYLVPFWNKNTKQKEAQGIIGYRGFIELARRSGNFESVEAHPVHAKDFFKLAFGLTPVLEHQPDLTGDPGELVLAYVIARFKDGGKHVEVMTRKQIEAVRERSKAGNGGPWTTDYEEMCRKTVVRRAAKYWPLSPELADALDNENENDMRGGPYLDVTQYTAPPKPGDQGGAAPAPAEVVDQVTGEVTTGAADQGEGGGAEPGAATDDELGQEVADLIGAIGAATSQADLMALNPRVEALPEPDLSALRRLYSEKAKELAKAKRGA